MTDVLEAPLDEAPAVAGDPGADPRARMPAGLPAARYHEAIARVASAPSGDAQADGRAIRALLDQAETSSEEAFAQSATTRAEAARAARARRGEVARRAALGCAWLAAGGAALACLSALPHRDWVTWALVAAFANGAAMEVGRSLERLWGDTRVAGETSPGFLDPSGPGAARYLVAYLFFPLKGAGILALAVLYLGCVPFG